MGKHTSQCVDYKLKLEKNITAETLNKASFFLNKIIFGGFHPALLPKTFPLMHPLLLL